jgi:hypothetical protein
MRGSSAGSAERSVTLPRDSAQHDDVGGDPMLLLRADERPPDPRVHAHRVAHELHVRPALPRVGADDDVAAVDLRGESAVAEQRPAHDGARDAIGAQLVEETDRPAQRELDRQARVLGQIGADAGQVHQRLDAGLQVVGVACAESISSCGEL